jgi:hypothetical protein
MKPKWKPRLPEFIDSHLAARKQGTLGGFFVFWVENTGTEANREDAKSAKKIG